MDEPKKMRFYPIWIAIALIIIFAIQTYFPEFTEMFLMTSNAHYQPWRFVTGFFLHGSLPHLMYNLFALVIFGLILEKVVGDRNFLLIYFSSGILANIVSFFFYDRSLGASGAIMGIIGTLTILKPFMGVFAFGMIIPMFVAAIIWVVGDLIGIFMPSNVGHIAHLSGIFVGIFFGILLRVLHNKKRNQDVIDIPEHMMRRWEALYMER